MGSSKKIIELKAAGLSAVTAEYVPIDNPSSLARSLIIHFDNDKDEIAINEKTFWNAFDERNKYSDFIVHYLTYIAGQGDEYMEQLNEAFNDALPLFKSLTKIHGRLQYNAAWIYAQYDVFMEYACGINQKLYKKRERRMDFLKKFLIDAYKDQRCFMTDTSGQDMFLSSLREMLSTCEIHIAAIDTDEKGGKTARTNSGTIGYMDDKYIYLINDKVFGAVKTHLAKCNKVLPINESSLKKYLYDKNILKSSNGRGFTVKLTINKTRIRVLKFEKSVFYVKEPGQGGQLGIQERIEEFTRFSKALGVADLPKER